MTSSAISVTATWGALPQEVLVNIFVRIKGSRSQKSGRSTCRQWRNGHGLSVHHIHPTDLQVDTVHRVFPSVTSLDLRRRTRGDHPPEILDDASAITGLKRLNLDSCRHATDASLAILAPLSQLASLSLSHCWWIKGAGLSALESHTALTALNLSGCDLCHDGLSSVARLPSLTSLDLNFCWRLGNDGIAQLEGAKGLRSLSVAGTRARDAGAQVVATLTGLTSLDMGGCELRDPGVQALAENLTGLQTLSIQQSLVTDSGLSALANIASLTDLNLTACCLVTGSGMGLTALAFHPALNRIRLKGCPLGVTGMEVVRDLIKSGAKEIIK